LPIQHRVSLGVCGDRRGVPGTRRPAEIANELEATWGDERRIEPEAYFDLGDRTLLYQVINVRGRQSGAEVALPSANVMRWRGGRCVYSKVYANREDALEALGVPEEALEAIAP
jgi:hypothetical protein